MWGITKIIFFAALFLVVPRQSFAFIFAPETADVSLQEGVPYSVPFSVVNDSEEEASFELSLEKLEFGEENEILAASKDLGNADIAFDQKVVSLGPNQQYDSVVQFRSIEDSSAVFGLVITEISNDTTGVGVEAAALIPIFVSSSDAESTYNVQSVRVDRHLVSSLPVVLSVRVHNDGGVTARPELLLSVRNIVGKEVHQQTLNPFKKRVVVGASRSFDGVWGQLSENRGFTQRLKGELQKPFIGYFTLELSTDNGSSSHSEWKQHVMIVPWRSLTLLVCALLGLAFIRHVVRRT